MSVPASFWQVFKQTWRLVVIELFIGIVLYLLEDKDASLDHVITRLRVMADVLEQRYLSEGLEPQANSPTPESDSLTSEQG